MQTMDPALVTALAALRNRCLIVLPPSGSEADIAAIMASRPSSIVIGDPERWPEAWLDPRAYRSWQDAVAGPDSAELAWQPAWDETAARAYWRERAMRRNAAKTA